MTTHSSILASRIPQTEESSGPQTIVSQSSKGLDQLSTQAHTPRAGRGGLSLGPEGRGQRGGQCARRPGSPVRRKVSCLYPLSVFYCGWGRFGGQS